MQAAAALTEEHHDNSETRPAAQAPTEERAGALLRFGRFFLGLPVIGIFARAAVNYVRHESANQAGHVAFSTVLALFPFMLFLSAAASFLGEPGVTSDLMRTISEFAPFAVTEALVPAIQEVLRSPSRTILTIGLFGAWWAASSGAQAIRTALNRAYGVEQRLSFWKARLKVLLFTIIGVAATVWAVSWIVVLPYMWDLLRQAAEGPVDDRHWMWVTMRYGVAFLVLLAVYSAIYQWLPDIPQRVKTVVPGAVLGAAMWLGVAALLSWALRGASKLTPIYGGFAGTIATLVFLYFSAVTLIFGAEINAVLRERAAARRR